ncbi:hypothetical protein NDU88_010177 [Pleurodeles waltl]|uniref:Uncharacterized protein n=1 Tax=Pleurodeles waltl TaxID=8319 RepID=A0AAV7S138_PLEWA|nr:hypothetical protein NDU88_010177 [Pleurodeles waltl]
MCFILKPELCYSLAGTRQCRTARAAAWREPAGRVPACVRVYVCAMEVLVPDPPERRQYCDERSELRLCFQRKFCES